MSYDERNEPRHGYNRFRATMHICMGILYAILGSVVIYLQQFGAVALAKPLAYTAGGLMIIYGAFRIWRGYRDIKDRKLDHVKRDLNDL